MSCPTCSHTLQCVVAGEFSHPAVYWCPRCGTLRVTFDVNHIDEVPKLVERCRLFLYGKEGREDGLGVLPSEPWMEALDIARRLGMAEAIYPPEERP